jgi:hypothetical protein
MKLAIPVVGFPGMALGRSCNVRSAMIRNWVTESLHLQVPTHAINMPSILKLPRSANSSSMLRHFTTGP